MHCGTQGSIKTDGFIDLVSQQSADSMRKIHCQS